MQVRITESSYDSRIFYVLLDFTGYDIDTLFPRRPGNDFHAWRWRATELSTAKLNSYIEPLGLRPLKHWRVERGAYVRRVKFYLRYTTVVISDRI